MANSNKKNNKFSKKKKQTMQQGGKRNGAISGNDSKQAQDWLRLLRNPCHGELARPCYTGMDSGYMVRTVNYFRPSVSGIFTVGQKVPLDFVVQWTPNNVSSASGIVRTAGVTSGGVQNTLPGPFAEGLQNFATNTNIVNRYRCTAACMRVIPTGSALERSGMLGTGYISGMGITLFDSGLTIEKARSLCTGSHANTGKLLETRWLPTISDERYTTTAEINTANASLMLVGTGVDGVATTVSTATASIELEFTAVYEWIPDVNAGQSASVSTTPPLGITAQQVLSTIKDLGAFIYGEYMNSGGRTRRLEL